MKWPERDGHGTDPQDEDEMFDDEDQQEDEDGRGD